MSSLATRGLILPKFPIPAKRYQGERLKGIATSSLQAQRTYNVPSKARICAGNMNFRCHAIQTQTVERKSPTISESRYAPVKGKANEPILDFGGGGPPPNDGSGGSGGGGGGWGSSGGFFLFLFLMFLDYLKELEEKSQRRRHQDDYDQLLL